MHRSTATLMRGSRADRLRGRLSGFREALDLIEPIQRARNGGLIERVLAVAGMAPRILDRLMPPREMDQRLRDAGFLPHRTPLASMIYTSLRDAGVPSVTISRDGTGGEAPALNPGTATAAPSTDEAGSTKIVLFDDRVAFLVCAKGVTDGPFIRAQEDLDEVVRSAVWRGRAQVSLQVQYDEDHPWFLDYVLMDCAAPGPLIGAPTPAEVLAELRHLDGPRTVMFVGPTGSGKSTLAYQLALAAAGKDARVLKIDRRTADRAGAKVIRDAARMLRPTVLLIDDVQERYASLLELLEACRVGLTVVTRMVDTVVSPSEPGALYTPGLRPGRVDLIYYIGLPDTEKRRAILSHHTRPREDFDQLVQDTEGLPPAYHEIAARLYEHHHDDWPQRIAHLKACAPSPKPKEPAHVPTTSDSNKS